MNEMECSFHCPWETLRWKVRLGQPTKGGIRSGSMQSLRSATGLTISRDGPPMLDAMAHGPPPRVVRRAPTSVVRLKFLHGGTMTIGDTRMGWCLVRESFRFSMCASATVQDLERTSVHGRKYLDPSMPVVENGPMISLTTRSPGFRGVSPLGTREPLLICPMTHGWQHAWLAAFACRLIPRATVRPRWITSLVRVWPSLECRNESGAGTGWHCAKFARTALQFGSSLCKLSALLRMVVDMCAKGCVCRVCWHMVMTSPSIGSLRPEAAACPGEQTCLPCRGTARAFLRQMSSSSISNQSSPCPIELMIE